MTRVCCSAVPKVRSSAFGRVAPLVIREKESNKLQEWDAGGWTGLGQGKNTRVYLSITDALLYYEIFRRKTRRYKRRGNIRTLRDFRRASLFKEVE
jgi:hypothetical protein